MRGALRATYRTGTFTVSGDAPLFAVAAVDGVAVTTSWKPVLFAQPAGVTVNRFGLLADTTPLDSAPVFELVTVSVGETAPTMKLPSASVATTVNLRGRIVVPSALYAP